MNIDPPPHWSAYSVPLRDYFERILQEHQRALDLAQENARMEAQRHMWIIGIIVTVTNIAIVLWLRTHP